MRSAGQEQVEEPSQSGGGGGSDSLNTAETGEPR